MDLTSWNPFAYGNPMKELEEMSNRLSRIFGRPSEGHEEALTPTEWTPAVDVIEEEKAYLIKAELPEVKKEDVKVSFENGVLTIHGERNQEKEEKGKKYHRIERSYGSFERSFTLPEDADATKIAAEYKDGVLSVRLPRAEVAKPKAIDIKIA